MPISIEKLEEASDLSDDIQSAANFGISLVFAIIYFVSFFCPPKSDSLPSQKNVSSNSGHPRRFSSKQQKQKKLNPWVVAVAIVYVMTYTLRYLLFCILWAIEDTKIPYIWEEEILEYFFDLCFVIASFAFNLLMILRLQTGFKGTMYQTKTYELVVLYVLLFSSFIINEFYFVIRHNRKKEGHIFYHDKDKHEFGVHTYLFLVLVILNFVLGGILMFKFNKNVWKLIEFRESCNSKLNLELNPQGRRGTIDTFNRNMDVMSKKFMGIAIKYTLLCSICIVCTNLQFFGWILLQFDVIEEYETILWFVIVWNWLFDLVLLNNFFCIWLSFSFSKWLYEKKYVCGCCSDKCEDCCAWCVGSQIYETEQKRVEMMQEHAAHETPVTIQEEANDSLDMDLEVRP